MENLDKTLKANVAYDWRLGPDNLHPAHAYTAIKLDEAVKLRIDSHVVKVDKQSVECPPISIFTKFKMIVESGPDNIALGMLYIVQESDCHQNIKLFILPLK
jgi:hypothetical protein